MSIFAPDFTAELDKVRNTQPPAPVQLSREQNEKWDETRTKVLWHAPFFAHIFYERLRTVFTREMQPIAATDGTTLLFHPEKFFRLNPSERAFVVCHEIAHCIFAHCEQNYQARKSGTVKLSGGGTLPYSNDVLQHSLDYVVNAMLIEAGVGKMPAGCLYDKGLSEKGEESWVEVYQKLFKPSPQDGGGSGGKGGGGSGGGNQSGQFDEHLDPGAASGEDPHTAAQERQAQAQSWANSIQQAATAAKAQGKLPGNIERMIGGIIEPPIDWRDHIQGFFARKIGNTRYNWQRPDRRLLVRQDTIIAPGRMGHGCGDIVVGVDTSGSIGAPELELFFGCLTGILDELRPHRLVVMWCDARVHRVDELEDAGELHHLQRKGAPGGGGTDFRPVFDEIRKMGLEPDALVYLTDLYGSFPKKPPAYPVLWARISRATVPWGDVVDLPEDFGG